MIDHCHCVVLTTGDCDGEEQEGGQGVRAEPRRGGGRGEGGLHRVADRPGRVRQPPPGRGDGGGEGGDWGPGMQAQHGLAGANNLHILLYLNMVSTSRLFNDYSIDLILYKSVRSWSPEGNALTDVLAAPDCVP